MDMIGDRAACREPVPKQPFVRIRMSKDEKYKVKDTSRSDNTLACDKIDITKEIEHQLNLKKKSEGKHMQFTDINLDDNEACAMESTEGENFDDTGSINQDSNTNYFQNMVCRSKTRK